MKKYTITNRMHICVHLYLFFWDFLGDNFSYVFGVRYIWLCFLYIILECNYLWFVDDRGNDKIHADEQHQERNENRNLKKLKKLSNFLLVRAARPCFSLARRICKYYAGIFDHQDSSYASSKPLYFCHWSVYSTSKLILFLIFLNNIVFFYEERLESTKSICDAAAKIHNLW